MSTKRHSKHAVGRAWLAAGGLSLAMLSAPAAADESTLDFGAQAWPGVTMKTEVAAQILEAMGYETETTNLGSQFIYQGIRTGDIDVSFGAWSPAHKPLVQPLVDDGVAIRLAKNLQGAVQGFAVPKYVWETGIHSVADLSEHGERFGRKIYGIEPGAALSREFREAIEKNYQGLGDWELMTSSTAGMLAQVGRATGREEPIVFHGWKPHWMAVKYDIRFLKDDPNSPVAQIESTVYTIVPTDFPEKHPEVTQFLRRYEVSPETQSQWIYNHSFKENPPDEVAEAWISQNLDTVAGWLEGVKTSDGGSGIEAVREEFGS